MREKIIIIKVVYLPLDGVTYIVTFLVSVKISLNTCNDSLGKKCLVIEGR